MTKSALLCAATCILLSACAAESSPGWGVPGSRCESLCNQDGPCQDHCGALRPGVFELRVVDAVATDDPAEPPPYQVYTSEVADTVTTNDDGESPVTVELMPNSFLIVDFEDDSCVLPAARGLLTCSTDRYEVVIELL